MLGGFERWPTWMWANREVAEFLDWSRDHNSRLPMTERVGFYGLDVHSLWDSLESILVHLAEHAPESLDAARQAYRCFEPYVEDPQAYAMATRLVPASCEQDVIEMLRQLRRVEGDGDDDESRLSAEQNAEVAVNAERYYRTMVRGGVASWNVRDTHMANTLERLMSRHGADAVLGRVRDLSLQPVTPAIGFPGRPRRGGSRDRRDAGQRSPILSSAFGPR